MQTSIDQKNSAIIFLVNTKIYSKEVVYKACYVFIDRLYILLDVSAKKDSLQVTLKGKTTLPKKELEKLEGEFMNELLNSLVRENVSKRNQKVLEQIVGGAMGAALGIKGMESAEAFDGKEKIDESKEIEASIAALRKELEIIDVEDSYEKDTLGIMEIVIAKEIVGKDAATVIVAKKNKKKKNVSKK